MFHGSMVAIVTPMDAHGEVQWAVLRALIDWHVEQGTQAIVINGTTGESATLTPEEQSQAIAVAVEQVADRVPVIAGTYAQSTAKTIALTEHAMQLGVEACLIMTPAYTKPTQAGLYQHYKAVANAVPVPLIMYNVPGRTAVDLLPETVGQLSEISNIIGLKEATGDVARGLDIVKRWGDKIDVYSGDDATAKALMLGGAKGVISVTANVAPALMKAMTAAALAGDASQADMLDAQLAGLHQHLFDESNPIPTKWALSEMGLIPSGIRLPLTPLSPQFHDSLKLAMTQAGINK